jgi:hypothetical protein
MKNLTKNLVALLKGFVFLTDSNSDNSQLAMTAQANIMKYGYMLDQNALATLSKSSREDIILFYNQVSNFLKEQLGGGHNYKPLYKNFPTEVMNLSDSQLFWNQIIHYMSNGAWEPSTVEMERPVAFENIKYNMLTVCDENKFMSIFTELCSLNTSLTVVDKDILEWFFVEYGSKLNEYLPTTIPFKETLCTLATWNLSVPVKSVTDVLRICVFMSGGDIMLPKVPNKFYKPNRWSSYRVENPEREKFRFKKFSRTERRYIMSLFENSNLDIREMKPRRERFLKLAYVLHTGEYQKTFPKTYEAFNTLRNTIVKSWYSEVESSFKISFEKGLSKLSERPGEFARRLDNLIRNNEKDYKLIIDTFAHSTMNVSNKVLFEVYTHFEGRSEKKTNRSIMIKGARKRTTLPDLPAIPTRIIGDIQNTVWNTLRNKFSSLPSLGNIYIDPMLKKIPLPTNMRSLNPSLKPIIRGQRIPFNNPDAKVVRAFLHFNKNNTNCTIDLSSVFVGESNAILDWSHPSIKKQCALHSGDSWVKTGACAEYIDIDIEKSIKNGYKYVLIQLHNYSKTPQLVENNYFGIMYREFPEANKLWLPETIDNCFTVKVENIVNCCIIDLQKREFIMVDEDTESGWLNNASILDFSKVENYTSEPEVSVYTLLELHTSRGTQTMNPDEADTKFMFDDFCTSYEKIAGLML